VVMELQDWLELLASRLRTIPKLTVTTDPTAVVVPPMATIEDQEIDYDQSMMPGGTITNVVVAVHVSSTDRLEGYREARRYLSGYGPYSVRQALVTPINADALGNHVHVETGQAEIASRRDGSEFIAARFTVRFHTPGPSL
jgi:hypothetical protein